jgi:hypothetical protein
LIGEFESLSSIDDSEPIDDIGDWDDVMDEENRITDSLMV